LHINELSKILNNFFKFRKPRADCLAQLIRAMLIVKTVNFAHLSVGFKTQAKPESSYKRIQRFFRFFHFDATALTSMVLSLFHMKNKKLTLMLDRTNWKFGVLDINILILAVAYKGISIPLVWFCLPKKGNSNTLERIDLVKKILCFIGPQNIEWLLGDREFIGEAWIKWLDDNKINFLLRVRNNSLLEGKIRIDDFFHYLPPKKRVKNCAVYLWGRPLILSTRWSYNKDELVTLISNRKCRCPFDVYRKRWEIETFFGCLKTRGFCFEDTHLVHLKRIENLICVLVIAFCWSHLVGEQKDSEIPIKKKSHGRKEKSLFRYGFDELRGIFLNFESKIEDFIKWIKLLIIEPLDYGFEGVKKNVLY